MRLLRSDLFGGVPLPTSLGYITRMVKAVVIEREREVSFLQVRGCSLATVSVFATLNHFYIIQGLDALVKRF